MKVDQTSNSNAEKLVQFQLMTQIFKQAVGNSDSFGLIMQSLTKAMTDKDGNVDFSKLGLQSEDLNKLGYGAGQRLNNVYKSVKSDIKSGDMSIDAAVDRASRKYGIDKDLIMAVIKQESDFNPKSVSWAGAMGLMQLMPENVEELGISNPYDVEQNVDGGTRHLRQMLDLYGNNKELALAAYNAGQGTLQRRGVKNVDQIYTSLPYETRDYVKKVMKYYGK